MPLNPWQVESLDAFNFLCCPECEYKSKEEEIFKSHALENHPQSSDFFGNPPIEIDVDIKVEQVEEPVQPKWDCDSCIEGNFNSLSEYVAHYMTKHNGLPPEYQDTKVKCELCNIQFLSEEILKLHVQNVHTKKTFEKVVIEADPLEVTQSKEKVIKAKPLKPKKERVKKSKNTQTKGRIFLQAL